MSTKPWRVFRYKEPKYAKQIASLDRHAQPEPARAAAVAEIIAEVREKGDEALVKFTKKFDGADLVPGGLLLPSRMPKPEAPVVEAIDYAIRNKIGRAHV